MNDNQIITIDPVTLTETEKNNVSVIVAKIVELIKDKHL
jgi:hypothetical protein